MLLVIKRNSHTSPSVYNNEEQKLRYDFIDIFQTTRASDSDQQFLRSQSKINRPQSCLGDAYFFDRVLKDQSDFMIRKGVDQEGYNSN